MNELLKERLNRIMDRIQSPEFLSNAGLGNEIGFYIFDYPPEEELAVRDHVRFILETMAKKRPDLRIAHVNLFRLLIDYLKKRKLYERALKIQKSKGDDELRKALRGPLHEEKIARSSWRRPDRKTTMSCS